MSTGIYLLTMWVMFGTILLVFGMKYGTEAFAARARAAEDASYRVLAEQALAAQAEQQAALAGMRAELAKVSANLAAVEKILKEVE